MGEKQTLTFIEACEAMRPLNCEELQGDLLPREAVRDAAGQVPDRIRQPSQSSAGPAARQDWE